jgi:hypothetical protein
MFQPHWVIFRYILFQGIYRTAHIVTRTLKYAVVYLILVLVSSILLMPKFITVYINYYRNIHFSSVLPSTIRSSKLSVSFRFSH